MDVFFTVFAVLMAVATIVFIAFPHLLFPDKEEEQTEKVGPVYWGVYDGNPTEEAEAYKKIVIKKSKKKEKVVAGSSMYALGRGTSMRM